MTKQNASRFYKKLNINIFIKCIKLPTLICENFDFTNNIISNVLTLRNDIW